MELVEAEAECGGGAALGPPSICRSNPRLPELPENITSMHDGFSRSVRQANMRLLRIAAVRTWTSLKVRIRPPGPHDPY